MRLGRSSRRCSARWTRSGGCAPQVDRRRFRRAAPSSRRTTPLRWPGLRARWLPPLPGGPWVTVARCGCRPGAARCHLAVWGDLPARTAPGCSRPGWPSASPRRRAARGRHRRGHPGVGCRCRGRSVRLWPPGPGPTCHPGHRGVDRPVPPAAAPGSRPSTRSSSPPSRSTPRRGPPSGWRAGDLLRASTCHRVRPALRRRPTRLRRARGAIPSRVGDPTRVRQRRRGLRCLARDGVRALPGAGATVVHARVGGPLGIARDWHPSVGYDPVSRVGWAGGYVGDGVAAANLAGRTLADLVTGRSTALTALPWVGHHPAPRGSRSRSGGWASTPGCGWPSSPTGRSR